MTRNLAFPLALQPPMMVLCLLSLNHPQIPWLTVTLTSHSVLQNTVIVIRTAALAPWTAFYRPARVLATTWHFVPACPPCPVLQQCCSSLPMLSVAAPVGIWPLLLPCVFPVKKTPKLCWVPGTWQALVTTMDTVGKPPVFANNHLVKKGRWNGGISFFLCIYVHFFLYTSDLSFPWHRVIYMYRYSREGVSYFNPH